MCIEVGKVRGITPIVARGIGIADIDDTGLGMRRNRL
jgi:hypothetical protein